MKNCKQCNIGFEVTDSDREFYDKVSPVIAGKKFSIPEPTLCPQCRYQRRINWRAGLHLFTRKSDKSGKTILSYFPQDAPVVAYSEDEWWADDWNPLDYGREVDFLRSFLDQVKELMQEVPMLARSVKSNENCDYVNSASENKNCYLIAGASYDEDCYYGNFILSCKSTVDCSFVFDSDLCYELVDCKGCYNLKYSTNCQNCSDSYFLINCRNSRNCFGSVNLENKEYVFFNEQLTKDEYEKKIAGMQLDSRSRIEEVKSYFEKHRLKFPYKYMQGDMNENVTGNGIMSSRNTFDSYDVSGLEDCKYVAWFHSSKNCMDIYAWGLTGSELCYECTEVGESSSNALFSFFIYNGVNTMYSLSSFQSENIFGCVSMRRNKYCILNKQYTKEEYEELVPRIIEHMKKNGEWGEFFPMAMCPFKYNQSIAQDYMPITKAEAEKLGANWVDEPPIESPKEKIEIPDSIQDMDSTICDKILTCEKTGRPYKIIPQEFKFYKANNIPIPALSFLARHEARLARRNPRKLWDRQCDKCQADISTSYSPESPEIVYCEQCYLKNVY